MEKVNEIIKEIKRKKEFSLLYDELIKALILRNKHYKRYLKSKKEKDKKLAIKQIRALLRKIITPMPKIFYKKFDYFLKNISKENTIDKLLKLNQSTRERSKDIYLWLIKKIKQINPKKIYDLGCGLNLLALWKFGLDLKKFSYVGFDVDGYIVRLINEFAKIKRINALVIHTDLSCVELDKLSKKESLVLALKILDALEEIKLGISKEIIAIKGKKIISFSLQSLSGKKIRQRFWFEKLLRQGDKQNKRLEKKYEKIVKDGEVFYLIP